jgi:hypothetical protein
MGLNVTQKLIRSHLVDGEMLPGREIGIRIDQTLTQDATGTLVMLELEAIDLDRVRTDISVQYVDHNLIQEDFKNPDDHMFLRSACRRFGIWYSPAGNGVSHLIHQERFGKPGKTLLGSDSHTPASLVDSDLRVWAQRTCADYATCRISVGLVFRGNDGARRDAFLNPTLQRGHHRLSESVGAGTSSPMLHAWSPIAATM